MDVKVESFRFSGPLLNDPAMFDIPRNFSYEENYHQKYFYPRLVLQRIRRRLPAAAASPNTDSSASLQGLDLRDTSLSDSLPSLTEIVMAGQSKDIERPGINSGGSNGLGLRRMSRSNDDISMWQNSASSFTGLLDDLRGAKSTVGATPDSGIGSATTKNGGQWPEQNDTSVSSFCSAEDSSNYIYFGTSDVTETSSARSRSSLLRRSSSMKLIGSKDQLIPGPQSPSVLVRKKSVRFADSLGLDLQSVRRMNANDSPPVLTRAALRDLHRGLEEANKGVGTRHMCLCFRPPGEENVVQEQVTGEDDATSPGCMTSPFLARVLRDNVSLEDCYVGPRCMTLNGTIRVTNLCYTKEVTVRYTVNNWVTFNDINASYVLGSSDGSTERFSFTIALPLEVKVGSRVVFAVCYRAVDRCQVFWDNNGGENYRIECFAKFVPVCESDLAWIHFL